MYKYNYKEILEGLRDFLKYLSSVWGILSVFVPLFPLFNIFNVNLPLPITSPELFKAVGILTGLFVIFYRFTHRDDYIREEPRMEFFKAIGSIIIYITVLPMLQFSNTNLLVIIFKVANPLGYIAIFYWLTNSFTILAIKEMNY